MEYEIRIDLIPLLEGLVAAIQPYACAHEVSLSFLPDFKALPIPHHPDNILPDLTKLLCRVIMLTPETHAVTLWVGEVEGEMSLPIKISNTGLSLKEFPGISDGFRNGVSARPLETPGTEFTLLIPLEGEESQVKVEGINYPVQGSTLPVSPFYQKLNKQLHIHFSSLKNLDVAASARSERDGIFIKKVNAIILAHLGEEGFDAESLGKALALSRSQLYRRLNPLIQRPPAHYIRHVRLQKAKEYLENGEGNVGEIAFRVGFQSQSHFTRAFREQFGFNPSYFRQNQAKEV